MSKLLISVVLILGLQHTSIGQSKATTEHGEEVLLYNDGTWKSADEMDVSGGAFKFESPPFHGKIIEGGSKVSHQLIMISSSPNDITDDGKWFAENNLSLPVYQVLNHFRGLKGNVPDKTPTSYKGTMLVEAIYDEQYNYFVYGNNFSEGRYLLVTDKTLDSAMHILDFENYIISPEFVENDRLFINQRIRWAAIEDNILFVSHSHNTYASSSKNMNAYVTAIDLETMEIIWRTKPLVCNTSNFVIHDDMIICGYGFTNEPDFLYTLNKKTGSIAQKIALKTGPEYIIPKEKKLFVRTYNMDYIFEIK